MLVGDLLPAGPRWGSPGSGPASAPSSRSQVSKPFRLSWLSPMAPSARSASASGRSHPASARRAVPPRWSGAPGQSRAEPSRRTPRAPGARDDRRARRASRSSRSAGLPRNHDPPLAAPRPIHPASSPHRRSAQDRSGSPAPGPGPATPTPAQVQLPRSAASDRGPVGGVLARPTVLVPVLSDGSGGVRRLGRLRTRVSGLPGLPGMSVPDTGRSWRVAIEPPGVAEV